MLWGYENPFSFLWDNPVPVCDAPHTKFTCYRAMDEDVQFEVAGLQEQPSGPAGPQPVPSVGGSYGDAWLSALHLQAEPGTNEMQITGAIGSHAEFVPMILELVTGVVSSLGVVGSGYSDIDDLGNAYRASFPDLTAFFAKFVDFATTAIAVDKLDACVSRFTFDFPIDFATLQLHYDRLADLLQHFDRLSARAVHPDTGDTLLDLLIEGDVLHVSFLVQDGKLCWEGSNCVPVSWSNLGSFTFDVAVDCTVRLLGMSVAALPFPHLRLRC